MHITPEYFLAVFDEFKGIPKTKLDIYLDLATSRVSQTAWGANYKYATALLTAHMLASTGSGSTGGQGGSAGGVLTGESLGEDSRSYAVVGVQGSGDDVYMTTRYGVDYIALRRESIVSATITGC